MRPNPPRRLLSFWQLTLVVLLAAVAAPSPAAAASSAKPTLKAEVLVDGDADNNVDAGPLDRRRDDVVVELDGAAMTRFAVAFGSGIRMRALPSPPRRRLVGELFVTTVPDPVRGLGTEDKPSGQTPTTTKYSLRLLPKTADHGPALEVAGSATISVAWKRSSRSLTFAGLPDNTVRLEFHTAGPIGVGLLSLAPVCRRDERLAGYQAAADLLNERVTASAPSRRADRCGTLPSPWTPSN